MELEVAVPFNRGKLRPSNVLCLVVAYVLNLTRVADWVETRFDLSIADVSVLIADLIPFTLVRHLCYCAAKVLLDLDAP